MGWETASKLALSAAAFAVFGCASKPTPVTQELQKQNKELQRQVSENDAEVKRLERLLVPPVELPPVETVELPADIPVKILKPSPPKRVVDEEFEPFDRRPVVVSSSHEAMTWYDQGTQLMSDRRFDEAVSSFAKFLKLEPEHVYADRAQFWIGECHFRDREYGLAVVDYNLLVSRYPQSVKVPEAMYSAALAHLEMGQKKPAQSLLQDLMRQYPLDGMADTASRKLAEIAGGHLKRF